MRGDAILIEEARVGVFKDQAEYDMVHERHRIFPAIFEGRKHHKILDLSAGVGIVGKRVQENYSAEIVCNDISPSCLRIMEKAKLKTVSFDLDTTDQPFPFKDYEFDALISLATIEHIIEIEHFVKEMYRIIAEDGYLYISAPNYCGLLYLIPFLITGRSFHNPLDENSKYEFFAHVRYFTYKTLIELLCEYGFYVDTVYLPKPSESSKFLALKKKSRIMASFFKNLLIGIYRVFGPRWCAEPVICLKKSSSMHSKKPKVKII
jgi:ubiquinone/menaquinone biosynthesis C-methylase UbiE